MAKIHEDFKAVVGKTIFSDGKGKLFFGYYKEDDSVHFVDYKTWKKLSFKDVSKGNTNKERVIKAILKNQKQFNKKVDFNMWAKKNNPSFEQTMDWFIQNGWINNINKGGIKESVDVLSVNEGISVFDERHFGKKGIIIMIDDNGKKVSAIFKDKKNADKYNRNNPSDIQALLKIAKTKPFGKAIDESVNEGKFKVDDLVYNKRTKTVGIVRMGDDKYGEVKTDADGNVDVDELEKYNPIKFKHQTKAKVAPSTEKEVSKRGLFNPFKNESVNELDINDPIMMKLRAAQMKRNKDAATKVEKEKKINPDYTALKNAPKIKELKKKRAQIMRDMEQEAEPEGGKIADRYGKELNKIDNDIIKLGGNPMSESVNEGKKRFNTNYGIGKSKYVVNYHDGVKKHKDGSDFFDIQIFKNQKDLEAFKKALLQKGFVAESVNEVSIPQLAKLDAEHLDRHVGGKSEKEVRAFVDRVYKFYPKDVRKYMADNFMDYQKGKISMKLFTTILRVMHQDIREGVKSVNEAKFGYKDSTASYIKNHNNEYKVAEKLNKGNEVKFYDELQKMEDKLGHPKFMIFISNALRGYGVDMYKDPKIKNPQDAQEALFLLSK